MTNLIPANIREAGSVLHWLASEFLDGQARRFYRAIVTWAFVMKGLELLFPWCTGLMILAFTSHASYIPAFLGLAVAHYTRTYSDWRASRARELFIGQAMRGLEQGINAKFFAHDVGQHIEDHKILAKSTLDKGRQRADTLMHLFTFWVADSLLVLVVTLPVLAVVSPAACGTVILSIAVGMAISSFSNRDVIAKADVVDAELRELLAEREDLWEMVERVMTTAQEDEAVSSFSNRFGVVLKHDRPVWLGFLNVNGVRNTFMTTALLFITWRAAEATSMGTMAVGTFISLTTWITIVIAQVNNLSNIERQVMWSVAPLKALRFALELPPKLLLKKNGIVISDEETIAIEFCNVSFRYPDGSLVLHNLNLRLNPGEKVALIGKSGSGKSTIGKLILRYMDPTSGVILVNGHDLRDLDVQAWRRRAVQIRQGSQIFTATLRENLLYGMPAERRATFTDEKLWAFMQRFRIDFGTRLKEGLDTKLGKNGEQISGGEAQRIAIGAAVLRNPGFMVIDEATSALDAGNQEAAQAALYEALHGGAGAILIAHRLSTIAGCDRIVMLRPASEDLHHSQIEAEARTLNELAALSPTFRSLAVKEGVLIDSK